MQQKPYVAIRTDAGTTLGMGHLVRCCALAEMIREHFGILFVVAQSSEDVYTFIRDNGFELMIIPEAHRLDTDFIELLPSSCSIIITDGYNFKTGYQRAIKSRNKKLVCIDDLHAWHQVADVVINHAAGVTAANYSYEPYTALLLGHDYVLLRPPFLSASVNHVDASNTRDVFISMGAADISNLTTRFSRWLIENKLVKTIQLMVSNLNPHLADVQGLVETYPEIVYVHRNLTAEQLVQVLQTCGIALCPASSISLEVLAVGNVLMTGTTAANQWDIYNGMRPSPFLIRLGDLNFLTETELTVEVKKVQAGAHADSWQRTENVIDKKSPYRVREALINLITAEA